MVIKHFSKVRSVYEYADMMHVPEKGLSRAPAHVLAKSPRNDFTKIIALQEREKRPVAQSLLVHITCLHASFIPLVQLFKVIFNLIIKNCWQVLIPLALNWQVPLRIFIA